MPAVDAQTLIDTAYSLGYDKLSDRDLEEGILALTANFTTGGSGGGGLVGHGSPEGVVTAAPGTPYLDLDTNNYWYKATGAGNTGWVELIAS